MKLYTSAVCILSEQQQKKNTIQYEYTLTHRNKKKSYLKIIVIIGWNFIISVFFCWFNSINTDLFGKTILFDYFLYIEEHW